MTFGESRLHSAGHLDSPNPSTFLVVLAISVSFRGIFAFAQSFENTVTVGGDEITVGESGYDFRSDEEFLARSTSPARAPDQVVGTSERCTPLY